MEHDRKQGMKHRIVVLGAGYGGVYTAGRLASRLHSDDFEITVVNAEPGFVERMRLHQVAAGQELKPRPLADIFAGTGVRLRLARVTAVDPDRRTVAVTDGDGDDELAYDTLVYALGSAVADHGVPGVAEHAFNVAGRADAVRLRGRLEDLGAGARVLVVGGGLTGIEAATEIAEARPDLEVTLATSGELGDWLSAKARRHLYRAFERLGVAVHEDVTIERVEAMRAVGTDGTAFPSEATVWSAGFAVHPIAAAGGLEVADSGRIVVDNTMRSVSHPEVYAVGDCVHVIAKNGRPLPMSCASAGFTGMRAAEAIEGRLTGRSVSTEQLEYLGNCIGLGSKDAVFQKVSTDLRPKWSLGGRKVARFKSFVFKGAAWNVTHAGRGLPLRKRRLASVQQTAEEVNA
jgi:NADH:ubiquinone reductase (H+-translocating)